MASLRGTGERFEFRVTVEAEPTKMPTSASMLPLGVTVACKGSPAGVSPLVLPTLEPPVMRCEWERPVVLETTLKLEKDGRRVKAKGAKLALVEAKKAGSGKVRPVATVELELSSFLAAPAAAVVIPMDVTSPRFVTATATVTVAVVAGGLAPPSASSAAPAPTSDGSPADPPSPSLLLRSPHAVVVATTRDGAAAETVIDGRHQSAVKRRAGGAAGMLRVAAVDMDELAVGPVFTQSAAQTGFVGAVVFGSGVALFLFQVASHAALMEALRVATFSTSVFRFAGVHLTGRIPGAALDPVRAAALHVPLSINANVGDLGRRIAAVAHPSFAPDELAALVARLTALQTVANGFPITITAADVAAYDAAVPDLVRADAPLWRSVARSRANMSREDLIAALDTLADDADHAAASALALHTDLAAAKASAASAKLQLDTVKLALTQARADAAAEAAAADAREAALNAALDDALRTADRLRAARDALQAENDALVADHVAARADADAIRRKYTALSVDLADAVYRAEQSELRARAAERLANTRPAAP